MKKTSIALLLVILVFLLLGCNKYNFYNEVPEIRLKLSSLDSPNKIYIEGFKAMEIDKAEDDMYKCYQIPQIASIFKDNEKGEFLALFYDSAITDKSTYNYKIYSALYLVKPSSQKAINFQTFGDKIAQPEVGFQIINADFNDNWLVWTETDTLTWKIYCLDRFNNNKTLVSQDACLKRSIYDLPGISLKDNNLVYNHNNEDSKIIVINLDSMQKETVFWSESILGAPVMSEEYIVWHVENLKSNKIYCYNLNSKKIDRLPASNSSFCPYIWNDYIAWLSSDENVQQLHLYNLKEKQIKFETKINSSYGFYRPTISRGIIAWPDTTSFAPSFYSIKMKEKKSFLETAGNLWQQPIENLLIMENWLIWNPSTSLIPPSPDRKLKRIGSFLLSTDIPLIIE